ncbi:MAG TPA: aldo/keto reductase [Anaerolineaceae bacterium]|nr:aldo/keto reductase [Anaerolineaceae bacterium]
MNYRHLGRAGLKVSELSFGAWATFGILSAEEMAEKTMVAAYEAGVNFFDNAEAYANGTAEIIMGNVIKRVGWKRSDLVISTKIFWGGQGPNDQGLSHKHILEGVNKALQRLQMEYVDLVFCHRPDPETPLEETVRAMDIVIRQGKAFYWGTSEWSAGDILRADQIAHQYGLTPPVMEQPQYNLFEREKMEKEFLPVFKHLGYGATIWSPLASGLLTGKYNNGIPEGSRLDSKDYAWLRKHVLAEGRIDKVKALGALAAELGCTSGQLALAWCLKNPNVSTVITGATKVEQVTENMKALKIVPLLTIEVMEKIETIMGNNPNPKSE